MAAWKELVLGTKGEFSQVADGFADIELRIGDPTYFFRGQSNADWGLVPALSRIVNDVNYEDQLIIEKLGTVDFQQRAHLWLPQGMMSNDNENWRWLESWTLMQHHGAPTRMLDWTRSLFVALYFAVRENQDIDGAIWVAGGLTPFATVPNVHEEEKRFFTIDEPANTTIAATKLSRLSERMIAQQAWCTVADRLDVDHADALLATLDDEQRREQQQAVEGDSETTATLMKLIIPAEMKAHHLCMLRGMNITAASLFPGIDGIGASIRDAALIRTYSSSI